KLIKIGAKVVGRGRYIAFQMAEVAIPRHMFQEFCGSSPNCGRSRRPRQRERADGHAFKSARGRDCARMPRKNRHAEPKNATPGLDRWRPALPGSRENRYHSLEVQGSSEESRLECLDGGEIQISGGRVNLAAQRQEPLSEKGHAM